MNEAYPLQWPREQARAVIRQDGPYRVTMNAALDDLQDELRKLGGEGLVVSTNIPTRRDGLPYANAREPADPGVAVYWTRNGRDFVIACDQYNTVRANIRAAGLTLHHLRRLEQAAPKFLADKAFEGFARLAPNAGADGCRPWRDVFEMWREHGDKAMLRRRFQELAAKAHPDKGGSHAAMAELNRAYQEGLDELSRSPSTAVSHVG